MSAVRDTNMTALLANYLATDLGTVNAEREREKERERESESCRKRERERERERELELQRERDQTLFLNGKDNY